MNQPENESARPPLDFETGPPDEGSWGSAWSAEQTLEEWRGADHAQHPWLSSATDLLVSWFPEPLRAAERAAPPGDGDWSGYFSPEAKASAPPRPAEARPIEIDLLSAWETPETERDTWNAEAAEGAVDCLFDFIHAIEARDIDAAMDCVADDYHVFDGDRDIDRLGLRRQIEYALDQWRDAAIDVRLTGVPDPVFHPMGVLIETTIQFDVARPRGARECLLLNRMAVLNETRQGRWLITALSELTPRKPDEDA